MKRLQSVAVIINRTQKLLMSYALQGSCNAGSTVKYGGCIDDHTDHSAIFQEPAPKTDPLADLDCSNFDIVKATQYGALNRVKGNIFQTFTSYSFIVNNLFSYCPSEKCEILLIFSILLLHQRELNRILCKFVHIVGPENLQMKLPFRNG